MAPTALKKVVRRVVRQATSWVREHPPPAEPRFADFAYEYLNATFSSLVSGDQSLRPHFVWGVLHAAHLTRELGLPRMSVIEFGVAGGNGLVSLENVAAAVEKSLGVAIDTYGFDTGAGLPPPRDYRDLPNLWREGGFPMNPQLLRQRLQKAKLVLGPVSQTVSQFITSNPAPVGFISFDLDYHSSTLDAFQLFEGPSTVLLPRVHCYFDDILAFTYSDFTGERLAIREFNGSHDTRKVSMIYGLRHFVPPPYNEWPFVEQMFMAHVFDHELYTRPDGLMRRHAGGHTNLKESDRTS